MKLRATHITVLVQRSGFFVPHRSVSGASHAPQPRLVLEHDLTVSPAPETMYPRDDYFGNPATFFSIHEPHRELIITSRSLVDLTPGPPPNLDLSPPWEEVRQQAASRDSAGAFDMAQFTFESPKIRLGAKFAAYAQKIVRAGQRRFGWRESFVGTEFHRVQIRPARDYGDHSGGRGAGVEARGVPGFRASDDRVPALAQAPRALRQRIRADRSQTGGRRCVPRMGVGVVPCVRLAGFRPHQQRDAARPAHDHRLGPRLFGCDAE